jgi:protein required for attachment to host cells
MKWIMVANSNDCKIYEYERDLLGLKLINEIKHPENRLREMDLVTNCNGVYKTKRKNSGDSESEFNHIEFAIDNFAREMAEKLNYGRVKNLYDGVVLLMPPTMEGRLFRHLNKHVFGLISKMIQKNIVQLSDYKIKKYLCKNMKWTHSFH